MKKHEKKPDYYAILDEPPQGWRAVRTLAFALIGLVVFLSLMAYVIYQVRTGQAVLPGGAGSGN